jgi:hypothetical protein
MKCMIWTASVVAVSPVMCSGIPNTENVNDVGSSHYHCARIKSAFRYER